MNAGKILIIEDEGDVAELLAYKLSERSGSERYIETVRGVGYRFRDQPVADTIPQQDAKLRLARSSKWRNESKVKVP